ncbi:hypothetical protein ACOMHN_015882 [Nucella lapillus]
MSGRGRQQRATKRPQRLTEPSPPSARKRQRPQPPDHSRRPETSRRSPSPAPSWPVQPVPTAEQIAAFLRAQPQPPTSTTTSNTSEKKDRPVTSTTQRRDEYKPNTNTPHSRPRFRTGGQPKLPEGRQPWHTPQHNSSEGRHL